MDKAEMEDKVRQTIKQNRRKIFAEESHSLSVSAGVCSDHASKAPRDCCRETVRQAAKTDSA
jgi:hypothetical protein